MSLIEKYIKGIRFLLPSPFSIAIILTLFTLVLAFFWPTNISFETPSSSNKMEYILKSWYNGLWNVKGVVPRNEDNWDLGFTDNNIVRKLDNPGVISEELIEKIKNNISSNTDQIFLLVMDVIELLKSKK